MNKLFILPILAASPLLEVEDRYIGWLLAGEARFDDKEFEYRLGPNFPNPGNGDYNSNSYISGLLKSVGIYIDAPPNTPGFDKSVPLTCFY